MLPMLYPSQATHTDHTRAYKNTSSTSRTPHRPKRVHNLRLSPRPAALPHTRKSPLSASTRPGSESPSRGAHPRATKRSAIRRHSRASSSPFRGPRAERPESAEESAEAHLRSVNMRCSARHRPAFDSCAPMARARAGRSPWWARYCEAGDVRAASGAGGASTNARVRWSGQPLELYSLGCIRYCTDTGFKIRFSWKIDFRQICRSAPEVAQIDPGVIHYASSGLLLCRIKDR